MSPWLPREIFRRTGAPRESNVPFLPGADAIWIQSANGRLEDPVSRLVARWVLTALCVILVAHVVPGFEVHSFLTALFAAAVIGLVNATLGLVLKIISFPFIILSFGLLLLLINAALLELASWFVPGFEVHGFWPAFWGALMLSILNLGVKWVVRED